MENSPVPNLTTMKNDWLGINVSPLTFRFSRNEGQAVIESVVGVLALMTFCLCVLSVLYFCSLSSHLHYLSHELLVCRETSEIQMCENKFRKQLRAILRFGSIDSLVLRRSRTDQSMALRLRFRLTKSNDWTWDYRDRILLPLKD